MSISSSIGLVSGIDSGAIIQQLLSLDAQAKVLRVIEEQRVQRVGGSQPIPTDVRLVAATNTDLAEESRDGTFREDLFYHFTAPAMPKPADAQASTTAKARQPNTVATFKAPPPEAPPPVFDFIAPDVGRAEGSATRGGSAETRRSAAPRPAGKNTRRTNPQKLLPGVARFAI